MNERSANPPHGDIHSTAAAVPPVAVVELPVGCLVVTAVDLGQTASRAAPLLLSTP